MNVKDIKNLQRVWPFSGEFTTFTVKADGDEYAKTGIINRQGEVILPADHFSCATKVNSSYFYQLFEHDSERIYLYNAQKREFMPQNLMFPLSSEVFMCKSDDEQHFGLAHENGDIILQPVFDGIIVWLDWFVAKENGKWSVITINGEKVLDMEFDDVNLQNPKASELCVAVDGKWFFISAQGERLTHGNYEYLMPYNAAGYAIMKQNGHIGIIDRKENVILITHYSETDSKMHWRRTAFCGDEQFVVVDNEKCGIIDIHGSDLLPVEYELIKNQYDVTHSPRCVVVIDSEKRAGAVDLSGKFVVPCQYKGLWYYEMFDVFTATDENGKEGLLDGHGKVLLPFEYDHISIARKDGGLDEISVTKNGECYFINIAGERVQVV